VKAPPSRNGNVLHRQLQARNDKAKLAMKAKSSRFDALVTRYYPAVYSFASRLTDDPREAIALTRDAFNSTRKQLRSCCDDNIFAAILISIVIRAGLTARLN
jgi:DNA-directed RNA polymerase specialized sigma24 family protein